MKAAILGDVHLADRPPASCTESYTDDMFDLLYQALDIACEHKCQALIQAGDWFHIKMPSRNSHNLVRRSIKFAGAASNKNCDLWIVPGNHDLSQDRLSSLDEGQPLGILFWSGAATELKGWGGSTLGPVYGVPWLQDWNAEDTVADQAVEEALKRWNERYDGSVPALIVTHAPFYPPGKELKFEHYLASKFADRMGNHGQVYYGHVHEPHGEYVVNGVRFCNNGALSRGSLTEYNVTRDVGVTIWDSDTGRFEFIKLDYKPAEEVFRIAEVTERKTAQMKLDEFLSSVGQASIAITTPDAVLTHVKSLGLGKDVEHIIEELLTEV